MKEKHKIIVTVEGGLVQGIEGVPAGVVVEVRDYDVDSTTQPERLCTDQDGAKYAKSEWRAKL